MQNIVTETDADAKKAIAYLKSHDGGRATFLPMSVIKGRELSENGLEQCEGFIGTASELCSCEQIYNGILQNLLGRIVVARDLDCATRIAKKYSYRFKIVTLDGQVVNAGGSLTGGSLAKNTGLLGRATEIEQIRKKASAIAEEAKDAKTEWQKQQETLALEQQAIEDCRSSLAKINENKIKITAEQKKPQDRIGGRRTGVP
jgi:chromosome segregation protein